MKYGIVAVSLALHGASGGCAGLLFRGSANVHGDSGGRFPTAPRQRPAAGCQLRKAGGSIEFHLLANGGHGFGLAQDTKGRASEDWITLLHRWMGVIDMMEPHGTAKP